MILKLFSLRRLRKGLLDLRHSSNKMLVIIKLSFIDETTKKQASFSSVVLNLFSTTAPLSNYPLFQAP